MSPGSRLATPVVLWLGLVGRLPAQEVHPRHGETIGRVVFPVSCTPEARTRFERAVALLHSFWYERAADTFREAVVADTACAMGYWGQAMSLFHPLWTPPTGADLAAGLAASERGLALVRTPRERDYLTAIRTYYADYGQRDHTTRLAVYAEAMDGVRRRHPRDREAAIFYALSLIALAQANATDTTFSYQRRADAILEPLFKAEPRHPGLVHYLIHTNDAPRLARLGLYAARHYAENAPTCRTRSTCRRTFLPGLACGTTTSRPTSGRPRPPASSRTSVTSTRCGTSVATRGTIWCTRTCSRAATPKQSASWMRRPPSRRCTPSGH